MEQKNPSPLKDLYGVVVLFFILLFVYSKFGPNIPLNLSVRSTGEPFFVSAEGKVVVPNSSAKVSVGIEETGASLAVVQESVNRRSKSLTETLKKFDIEDSDIKTTSYNIYPQQDFTSGIARIVGYSVSTSYEVFIRDVEKLNDVLGALTGAGANTVGGVSFDVDEKTRLEKTNEARELAVKNAKEKADGLAKAAGVNLGRIVNVSESETVNGPKPIAFDSAAGEELRVANPSVEPGTNEIVVNVTLGYEIR